MRVSMFRIRMRVFREARRLTQGVRIGPEGSADCGLFWARDEGRNRYEERI